MKKTIAWFLVLLFAALYTFASYGDFKNTIAFRNKSNSVFGSDKYKFGDLFGISYYPLIKQNLRETKQIIPVENPAVGKKINLCLAHDSYLGKDFLASKAQIGSADTIYDLEYPWFRGKANTAVVLDTSKTNVLVFEIVERNLFRLDKNAALNLVNLATANENPVPISEMKTVKKKSKFKQYKEIIFNTRINKNLEFLLFDVRLFTPIKELKSYINYTFFNRLPPEVFISENQKQEYISDVKTSIEDKITVAETEKMVSLLNEIHDFYKNKGFDKVYFSIVPNPVAIIKPEALRYNNLIPMIQNSPNLRMPMIDIYTDFKKCDADLYFFSDTHWNRDGFTLWINKFNAILNADLSSDKNG